MDKKVKALDITTLLSLMFYIAAAAFIVMGYLFLDKEGAGLDSMSFALGSKDAKEGNIAIASLITVIGFAFVGLAVVTGVYVGIMYLITDWGNEELNKKAKLLGGLNICPLCLSIPANILTKTLVKEYVHDGPKESKPKKEKKSKDKKAEEKTTTATTSTATQQQQVTPPQAQGFGFGQPAQTGFVAPLNEAFQYNGKWMFFDGQYYYEADANNQWVPSSTIPQ